MQNFNFPLQFYPPDSAASFLKRHSSQLYVVIWFDGSSLSLLPLVVPVPLRLAKDVRSACFYLFLRAASQLAESHVLAHGQSHVLAHGLAFWLMVLFSPWHPSLPIRTIYSSSPDSQSIMILLFSALGPRGTCNQNPCFISSPNRQFTPTSL